MGALIALAVIGGAGAFVGSLVWLYGNSQRKAGQLEEHNAEQAKADEAKERANDVLAERRDPDDAVGRLRDGNF